MGNWHIAIQGIGPHHNPACDEDADKLAKAFVELLRSKSQTVESATFTAGGKTDLKS